MDPAVAFGEPEGKIEDLGINLFWPTAEENDDNEIPDSGSPPQVLSPWPPDLSISLEPSSYLSKTPGDDLYNCKRVQIEEFDMAEAWLSKSDIGATWFPDMANLNSISSRQGYVCTFEGCTAPPFQTQYLLNTHVDVHSFGPYFCPVQGCVRSVGDGMGCHSKAQLARHLYMQHRHEKGSYFCPWCPSENPRRYMRLDYLQRHIQVRHFDKVIGDPTLLAILAQRPDGPNGGRRRKVQLDTPTTTKLQEYGTPFVVSPTNSHMPIPLAVLSPGYDGYDNPDGTSHPESSGHKPDAGGGFEVPFTDSGYASAAVGAGESCAVGGRDEDDSDSKTVISAATTVIPSVAQHSISEVCNNIYNRIQRHVDHDNRIAFFDALPDLIKAFAIRLAHLDSSGINRRIMHFVYSRHLDIASKICQMFQADLEDEDVPCRRPEGGMSIAEKMLLWETKPLNSCLEVVDPSDCFQGVGEDINESTSHPELPTYSRMILQSRAYEWLIQHLLKEASFHWGGSQPRPMVGGIRRAIMNGLPTGRISKDRDPSIHQAEFRIPLQKLKRRLLREMGSRSADLDWKTVSTTVVLVSSSDDCIQATTVEEYIGQTWGEDRELLTVFWATLAHQFGTTDFNSGVPKDIEEISASPTPASLSVFVKGVSYSVAEQGEQLAWLLAALQNSDDQEIIYSTPSVVKSDAGDAWELQAELTPPSLVDIGGLSTLKKLGWLGKFFEPVIARGFPTTRRPSSLPGVEVSPSVLLSFISDESLVSWDGRVCLFAIDQVLKLVELKQGVCLWHALPTEVECICRCGTGLRISGGIRKYRHIVDICPGPEDPERKVGSTPTPANENTRQTLDASHSPFASTTPNSQGSTLNGPETSLDSEMMSIPDSPEAPPYHIPDELSPILDAVACRLLQEYKDRTWRATPTARMALHGSPPGCSPDTATGSGTVTTHTQAQGEPVQNHGQTGRNAPDTTADARTEEVSKPSRKRSNGDDEQGEDANDGQGNMPPPKRPRRGQDFPANKRLACPFWKLDPVRHRNCLKLEKFSEVNRVKQHLTRKHKEPDIFCDRCKTIFQDKDAHQRHLQEASGELCVFKPWDSRDRLITSLQQKELHKKSKAVSEPKRWFAIWHILFPDLPPPSSPYIDMGISDDLRLFREYAQGQGRRVLLEGLRPANFHLPDFWVSEEALEAYRLEAVDRALDSMLDDFMSFRSSPSDHSSGQRRSSRSELSGQGTPLSSFADSGVGLSNQHVLPPIQEDALLAGPIPPPPGVNFGESRISSLESHFDNSQAGFPSLNVDDITAQGQPPLLEGDLDGNQSVFPSLSGYDATGPDGVFMQVPDEEWSRVELGEAAQAPFNWNFSWALDPNTLPPPDLRWSQS